jgi:2-keto-myo-inositol isomerase
MTAAIYLNGATLMTTVTQRLIEIAREAGYAGIEARAERLLNDATEVKAAAGIVKPKEVLTVNGLALTVRPDGSMDRRLIEDDLDARLAICQALTSPYLLSIPPRAPGLSTGRAVPGTRDALELARDRAGRLGIRVAFEFLGFGDCPINSPDIAAETVDGVEGVDLVLDSCHWHASGSRSLAGYPVERLVVVHLNDAPDKPPRLIEDADRVLPGDGVIRLTDLKAELTRHNYQGPFSLETFNPGYWREDPETVAIRGFQQTRSLLNR